MENGVKQRIKMIIENTENSVNSFAKEIGVKQTTLSDYLNNGKTPSWAVLRGVVDTFNDVSVEWLLRGEGEMYISDIPKDGDTEEVIDLKVNITKLKLENERLVSKVEQTRRERDQAIKERDQLMLENRAINRRVDKLIDILYQDPASRTSMAADTTVPYTTDTTLVG